jgi:hypothetical protein
MKKNILRMIMLKVEMLQKMNMLETVLKYVFMFITGDSIPYEGKQMVSI